MKEFSGNYLDDDSKELYLFEVHLIQSKADLCHYDTSLGSLPNNPFMKKELFPMTHDEKFGYATLHDRNNTLLVLFPFIYRKIYSENKDVGYYDITSPYGFGGPIIYDGIEEKSMKQFWGQLDKWYIKNNVVSEFVRFNFRQNILGFSGSIVPTLKMVHGNILPEEELWKNFKPKVRNNVRKGLAYGLKARIYHGNIPESAIGEFVYIYDKTMRRHSAEMRYLQEKDYFRKFIHNNPQSCCVVCVYFENKVVSTELLLLSKNAIYSYLGGSDEAYFFTRPNDFLKWEVMKWGQKNGFTEYHLGGGKEENDSLYKYKKRFFPHDKDRTFFTGRKIILPDVYQSLVDSNPHCEKEKSTNFFPLYRYEYS